MVPPQVADAARLLAIVAGFWLLATLLCAPALLGASVRRLFDGWPTGFRAVNYALSTAGLVAIQIVGIVASVALLAGTRSNGLAAALVGAVGGVGLAWTGVAVGLPASGRWDPTGDGWDGRVVLAATAIWYVVSGTVAVAVAVAVFVLFNYPG